MRKGIIKKGISLTLAIVMLAGVWQSAAEVRAENSRGTEPELLVHYEFKDGGSDSSGNGNDAWIGEGVTITDGIASLPGGKAGDSAYITLPEGVFDHQDTLTIATWICDKDPQENWLGAFFIGSEANTSGYPENYFYFVPCEKQHNTLKSVITDSVNGSQPWSTEKGIRESVDTAFYKGTWTHYAIVVKPGSMTCYIDGEQVGSQTLSRTISDFGTGLQSYIGKSNYTADPLYQGDFKDFRVYADELDEKQIQEIMGSENVLPQYSMEIDGDKVKKELSASLYGLFYEDINSAADGGLYPEMVKNYSFENAYVTAGDTGSSSFKKNGYQTVGNYKLHWEASSPENFSVEDTDSLNERNPHYAVITGNITLKNGGFAPKSDPNGAAMAIKPLNQEANTGSYTFSVFAKALQGYKGTLKVKVVDAKGKAITDEKEVPLHANGQWEKVSVELTSTVRENTKGKMVFTVEGADSSERLQLDMVSLIPHDSYGYGNKNYAYGVGIRQDLLELMMDLNPKFMRFPGGCIVEGFNWEGVYDWRDSVGALEQRKSITNRWENWGNSDHSWGYMQSLGFGYHEILSLCEDFGMEAFPIISAGVLCQYETSGVDAKTGEELQYFIDMATDLLDYCWGEPDKNEWAAKRAENGHPEPFDLKYLGIGNENFQAKYFDNLDVMKKAVEEYAKAHYPDRELTVISSAGPTATGTNLEYAYDRLAQTMPGETLVDEHYYVDEAFMYNQSDRYDYYQRTGQGGSPVFVGEYAVKNDNKYNTALAEAAYITGLERNADVVTNISYAPLLYKVGSLNWSHDLIYFDEFDTAKSANYYVQKMFADNYGTELIETKLLSGEKDFSNYGSPILGMKSSEGSIDKITVLDQNGEILLEDDFIDNSNGWESFSASESGNSFSISDGRLNFKGTNGVNAVYLPRAIQEHWENYKIIVDGAVKTGGSKGFVIGAGHDQQYYWYHMGKWGNTGVVMEVTRAQRNETALTTKMLGNHYANRHYNTSEIVKIQNNDSMQIVFNYGVEGKLEASYTSEKVSGKVTGRYAFSSDLNQYQTDIYQVVNKDQDYVYVKLVNPDRQKKEMTLSLENLELPGDAQMEILMLTGGLNDANAIGNEQVAPVSGKQAIEDSRITYVLPGYSVNVLRIPLSKKGEEGGEITDPPSEQESENITDPPSEQESENNTNPPSGGVPGGKVTGISFSNTEEKILAVNDTCVRTAVVTPENAVNAVVTYRSTNQSVAQVDPGTGRVRACKPGIARIEASCNGKTAFYTVKVKPQTVSIKKSVPGSGKVSLKWKKVNGATGYQIYISYNRKFKNAKKYTVKKGQTVSRTVTRLKKGKVAYIRIRAYTKSGGVTIYGDFSRIKKQKISH